MANYDIEIRSSIYYGLSNEINRVMKNLPKNKEIHVAVASLGGSLFDGLNIFQMFKDHGNVTVHFVGPVASAATVLALGAKKIIMAKQSIMLIHNASYWLEMWDQMNKEQISKTIELLQAKADDLKQFDEVITNLYVDKSNQSTETIQNLMKKAAWINSEKAHKLGLVDKVEKGDSSISNSYIMNQISSFGYPNPKNETEKSNPVKELLSIFSPNNKKSKMEKKLNKSFGALNAMVKEKNGLPVNEEGKIEITTEQAQAINDSFLTMGQAAKNAADQVKELQKEIKDLEGASASEERSVKGSNGADNSEDEFAIMNQVTKDLESMNLIKTK